MPVVKKINHIAVLVDDLEATIHFWQDALGLTLTHTEEVPGEQAVIAFLPTGDSEIELVKPTSDDFGLSPLPGEARAGHASYLPGSG